MLSSSFVRALGSKVGHVNSKSANDRESLTARIKTLSQIHLEVSVRLELASRINKIYTFKSAYYQE